MKLKTGNMIEEGKNKMIKKIMKKACMLGCLIFAACFMAGCGNSGTKERLKTGEERALELKEDAQEVVDQMNEDTMNIHRNDSSIEEE